MTDYVHLDRLVSATSHRLHLQLLETFRDVSRDPNTASSDYATRLKTVMEDALENCETMAQPEGLRDSLTSMQKQHKVSKGVLKKLYEDITARRKTEDAEDESYHSVVTKKKAHEPENEEEVRRLFGSLVA